MYRNQRLGLVQKSVLNLVLFTAVAAPSFAADQSAPAGGTSSATATNTANGSTPNSDNGLRERQANFQNSRQHQDDLHRQESAEHQLKLKRQKMVVDLQKIQKESVKTQAQLQAKLQDWTPLLDKLKQKELEKVDEDDHPAYKAFLDNFDKVLAGEKTEKSGSVKNVAPGSPEQTKQAIEHYEKVGSQLNQAKQVAEKSKDYLPNLTNVADPVLDAVKAAMRAESSGPTDETSPKPTTIAGILRQFAITRKKDSEPPASSDKPAITPHKGESSESTASTGEDSGTDSGTEPQQD